MSETADKLKKRALEDVDALTSLGLTYLLEEENSFGKKYLNAVKKVEVKFHYWVDDTLKIWKGMSGVQIDPEIDPFGLIGGPYIHVETLKAILSDIEKEYKNDKK